MSTVDELNNGYLAEVEGGILAIQIMGVCP